MQRTQYWSRRWRRAVLLTGTLLTVTPAYAKAPNDAKARARGDVAINEHYLAMNLKLAETELLAAIELCQGNKCTASVEAGLRRDLAMVYLASKQEGRAKQQLKQALAIDPGLRLNPDLTTEELRQAFLAAGGVEGPAPTAPPPSEGESMGESIALEEESEPEASAADDTAPSSGHWLNGALQVDALWHKSTADACNGTYFCYTESNTRYGYRGEPPLRSDYGNQVDGGPSLATIRLLAGYDNHLFPAMTVGARVGFAFRGGPSDTLADAQSFLPLHLELRAQRLIGQQPFAKGKFTPYLGVQGGIAQVDSGVPIDVYTVDAPVHYELKAYRKTGKGFVGLSAGSFYRVDAKWAPFAELVIMQMLPVSAQVIAVRLGSAYAL